MKMNQEKFCRRVITGINWEEMSKCKCIKEIGGDDYRFQNNGFYEYEYVPAIAHFSPKYTVFQDEGKRMVLTISQFKEHFKIISMNS